MIDNKGIELWQETNKLLARIAVALERRSARKVVVRGGRAFCNHDWALVDERAPHYMGYRCTRCGMEAA